MAKALPLLAAYDYVFDAERVKSLSPFYLVEPIDYYESVRIAYSESADLRSYLGCKIEEIDKDLKSLWPLTYKIVRELQNGARGAYKSMIHIQNVDVLGNPKSDDLKLGWIIGRPTPLELKEQEHQQ